MKSALILCGGKSSRFGGENKAFFPFDHRCFLEKILDELNGFDVFLSVDDPKIYQQFPQKALVDPVSIGPLGGLWEGLKHIKGDWIFVASCDIPRITADFVSYLEEFCLDGVQAVIPKDRQGQLHPLCGFYHKSVLELVESQIQKDKLKLNVHMLLTLVCLYVLITVSCKVK
ncbi:MAG: molybdenum cofactor guanylyltransferase [Brevinema sp.]